MNEQTDDTVWQTLRSIWISVMGILFMQISFLRDEVVTLASSRRFWLTFVSAFGLFWLVVSGGYTVYWVANDMGTVGRMLTDLVTVILISTIPFLLACALSHQYLKGDAIRHNHTIMIVFAARLVIFAVVVLVQMIVYSEQFDFRESAGLAGVVNLLQFDVDKFLNISGMHILIETPFVAVNAISIIGFVLAAYFYWLLYQGLRLVHAEKKPSDLLIAIIIIALCVEILPITVYGLIG